MFHFDLASLLLGGIMLSVVAYSYLKIAPRIKSLVNRGKRIDVGIVAKLATCATEVGIDTDVVGEKILVFTYRENKYAIQSNCSVAMEIAPDRWTLLSMNDGIDFINAMQPRKVAKQENSQNSQSKQQGNNGDKQQSNGNNGNGNKNTIPADQCEKWLINDKAWDEKPTKFILASPYFFRKLPDGGYGVGKNGKS